jgi:hypothetical protein
MKENRFTWNKWSLFPFLSFKMKKNTTRESRTHHFPPWKYKKIFDRARKGTENDAQEWLQNPPSLASLFDYVTDWSQPSMYIVHWSGPDFKLHAGGRPFPLSIMVSERWNTAHYFMHEIDTRFNIHSVTFLRNVLEFFYAEMKARILTLSVLTFKNQNL